jgi:hypothetical protein
MQTCGHLRIRRLGLSYIGTIVDWDYRVSVLSYIGTIGYPYYRILGLCVLSYYYCIGYNKTAVYLWRARNADLWSPAYP